MQLLEVVFPVFSIVLIGYLYARRYRPDLSAMNQIALWVLLPALVFDVMARESFALSNYGGLAVAGLIVVLVSGLIAWPVCFFAGYKWRAFVPSMMFNNCGNLGLPLALLAFGEDGLQAMLILLLVSNTLHFSLGIWMFGGAVSIKELLLNPVCLATFAGLLVNFSEFTIPPAILRPVEMLGQIVIPFMLFSLGTKMTTLSKDHINMGLVGAVVCPLSGLIPAAILSVLMALSPPQISVLLLFSVLPPAVLNYLLADQYKQDAKLTAAVVLLGNALAVVFTGGVLYWSML